jgi:hypothetical protein
MARATTVPRDQALKQSRHYLIETLQSESDYIVEAEQQIERAGAH